ncbi:MAG: hypothetical protein AAB074_02260 [Planctomycetota bacterium]
MTDPRPADGSPSSRPAETAGLRALVVIPILVVLLAGGTFAIFGYYAWSGHTRDTPSSDELERITVLRGAILAYAEERGALPPGPSSALVRALATPSKRGAPYLQIPAHALTASGDLLDGWGSPVCYRVVPVSSSPGSRGFELYSFGPNKKDEGGAGDDVCVED